VSVPTACVIGVDIGTYEAKGVAVDETGTVLASAVHAHTLSAPRPGFAEHDADEVWWRGFVAIVSALLSDDRVRGRSIAAVACSGIGPCVLPIDAQGAPLRPAILYGIDTRATDEIAELTDRVGDDAIVARSGNLLSSQSAGPKIAWLRRHEPEVHARARMFVTCQSYLVGRLTGEWVMDHATAGYFHPFYDLAARRWDTAGFHDIVDESRLPRLAWSTDVVGTVTADAAAQTGLPVGTPVLAGSADAPAEALSAGVRHAGEMMLMYGSSHFLIEVVDEPIVGTRLYTAPYLFEGTYVLAGGTSTAGSATRWLARLMGRDTAADPGAFADLAAEAASSPPGANGLLMLPHFSGERTPHDDPHLVGGILGLTLAHSGADVYRALLEGIAQSACDAIAEFDRVGRPPTRIAAVGGGTRNHVWMQAISDISGRAQHVVEGAGASFGDAMLAALAVGFVAGREDLGAWVRERGTCDPQPQHAALYREQSSRLAAFRAATASLTHPESESDWS